MELRWQARWVLRTLVLLVTASVLPNAARASGETTMTIGGVVYTDIRDPVRNGLEGVIVEVRGEKGTFEAMTGRVIGLWKLDVPQGTYTVIPRKKDYAIQHVVGGSCDGQRSITIEVEPQNIAANQSIQFFAIDWPDPKPEPQQAIRAPEPREMGRTGGGCAMVRGGQSRAADFFAPYAACLSALLVTTCVDGRRRRG